MAAPDPLHIKLYEILVRQHHRQLMSYGLALHGGDRHAAEDLVQDALVVAFQRMGDFDQSRDFAAWVRGIMRNKASEGSRKRVPAAIDPSLIATGQDPVEDQDLEAAFARWDGQVGADQPLFQALRLCLSDLSEELRATLEAFYFKSQPASRIAEELGSTVDAIHKRLQRGRAQLHRCLHHRLNALTGEGAL